MKTIVELENLEDKVWQGSGYIIGSIREDKVRELNSQGFGLMAGTLAGRFEGVSTFLSVMTEQRGKVGTRKPSKYDSSQEDRSGSWVKFRSYEQGMEKMLKEPHVFRNFSEADVMLKDQENAGIEVDYGVSGDYLDIDRVLEGEPEAFGIMRNGRIIQQFCSIAINGNHNAHVSQKDIDAEAQRVLRLVDMLETNNVRCEVAIYFSNDNSHSEIRVKQYQDLLDIDDLAVAMSPDFFRRGQFMFTEHSQTMSMSYGSAIYLSPKTLKDEDATATIVIGNNLWNINGNFDSLEAEIAKDGMTKDYSVLL